jgi:hypothetical protein
MPILTGSLVSMKRPHVMDGSGGLKIWWVAVNMFNKQAQTDDDG